MAKYDIWDKKSDIYANYGKKYWTAKDFIEQEAPWAGLPNAKVIISAGPINGAFFENFYERVEFYRSQGVEITEIMSDKDVLNAMEEYDLNPPERSDLVETISILLGERDDDLDIIING